MVDFFFAGSLGWIGGIFEDPQGFLKGPGHRFLVIYFFFPNHNVFSAFQVKLPAFHIGSVGFFFLRVFSCSPNFYRNRSKPKEKIRKANPQTIATLDGRNMG